MEIPYLDNTIKISHVQFVSLLPLSLLIRVLKDKEDPLLAWLVVVEREEDPFFLAPSSGSNA
jgi:hypothetical protein